MPDNDPAALLEAIGDLAVPAPGEDEERMCREIWDANVPKQYADLVRPFGERAMREYARRFRPQQEVTITEEMVERAAKAIAWDRLTPKGRETCDWLRDFAEVERIKFRIDARMALTAVLASPTKDNKKESD